jgi:RNA polymerase sigma-70 factor (ECF subfamily)
MDFSPHEPPVRTLTLRVGAEKRLSTARAECPETGPVDPPPDFAAVVAHWPAVYRLLDSLTGDAHAAEDLTQETFLRALGRYGELRPGSNLRAWLLRIATNAFFDERRKRKRSRTGPLDREPPASGPPPGQALETAERCARLRAALGELSDLTRLVFHLRAQEELSFREIAELAGTTEQAARWHMHQARTKLLERLGDDF